MLRVAVAALLSTSVLAMAAVAGQAVRAGQAIDVSGTWRIPIQSNLTCIAALEQDGSDFRGQADCDTFRVTSLEGQVNLATGQFSARAAFFTLDGTFASDGNSMSGTWRIGPDSSGSFNGERADDLEPVDLSGEYALFMDGERTDTCALSINQLATSATASLDCQSLGQMSSPELTIGQFSRRIFLYGMLGGATGAFEGQLAPSGEYISGTWHSAIRRNARGTFLALPKDQLSRGVFAIDCNDEPGLQNDCPQNGAGFDFQMALVVVASPGAGFAGFDALLDWDPQVLRFIRASEAPPAGCIPLARIAVVLPIPPYPFGCEMPPGLDASPWAGQVLQLQLRCDAPGTTNITLGEDTEFFGQQSATTPMLINASAQCYARTRDGPSIVRGDVNCDDRVNSIDAAVFLQYEAGLLEAFVCQGDVDLNQDGRTNSVDALFILQYIAGLIGHL